MRDDRWRPVPVPLQLPGEDLLLLHSGGLRQRLPLVRRTGEAGPQEDRDAGEVGRLLARLSGLRSVRSLNIIVTPTIANFKQQFHGGIVRNIPPVRLKFYFISISGLQRTFVGRN